MLCRDEKQRLTLNVLDLTTFLYDLFDKCETKREVEWLEEELQSCIESVAGERLDELSIVDTAGRS